MCRHRNARQVTGQMATMIAAVGIVIVVIVVEENRVAVARPDIVHVHSGLGAGGPDCRNYQYY
jgi:hypothetical protein